MIKPLGFATIAKIAAVAEQVVNKVIELDPEQKGAVVSIADQETGTPLLYLYFGNLNRREILDGNIFVTEKNYRLSQNPQHQTSHESRDVRPETKPKKYGGAVRTRSYLIAFSYFKEQEDTAGALMTGVLIGDLTEGAAEFIATKIGCAFYERLKSLPW